MRNTLKKNIFIFILFICFSCKKGVYLPKAEDASLASLRFSEGLTQKEKFNPDILAYTLEVPSTIKNFYIICVPNNPHSKCTFIVDSYPVLIPYVPIDKIPNNFDIHILVRSPNGEKRTYTVHVMHS